MKQSVKKLLQLMGTLVFVILATSIVSCSNDDEPENENLKGVWYGTTGEEGSYPYFIVENEFCYFSNVPIPSEQGEKYKYTYDPSKKIIFATEIYEGKEYSTYEFTVIKLTKKEIWLDLRGSVFMGEKVK